MGIRFAIAQALFGLVFGAVIAHNFAASWWGYVLAIPTMGALAYFLSLWRLRSLGLKPSATFIDYIEEWKKRWR